MRLTPPRISSQRKRFWTALRWIVGKSSTPRRSNRFAHRLGFVVEALENRLFLSATDTLLSSVISALPPSTVQVGGDGSLYFRLGNQADAGVFRGQGGVALEGGGTDVDQAFQWMIGRMGGKGDLLVLRADNSDGYNSYIYDFGGVNSVSTLVVPNRAAAFDPFITQAILNADAVFIAGGSQNLYLDYWKGTPVQSALTANIARGTPVGGTSAGTDILGQFIYSADYNSIRSAAALTDPFDPSMTFDRNFVAPGLIPSLSNTILDTHFQNRDREGRMVSFLGRVDGMGWSVNNRPMGIGIDQETALLIAPNGQAQVVGNSGVRATQGVEFLQTPGLPQVIQPGQPLTYSTLNGLDVPVGGTFNLSNWSTSFANPGPNSVPFTVSVDKGVLTRSGPIVSVTSSIVPSSTTSTPSDPAPSFQHHPHVVHRQFQQCAGQDRQPAGCSLRGQQQHRGRDGHHQSAARDLLPFHSPQRGGGWDDRGSDRPEFATLPVDQRWWNIGSGGDID
ncbi:MAG: cyanophycinase [Planctomycetota bacterium]|nr:cyanophycinase [Planctomycetota bacterium]